LLELIKTANLTLANEFQLRGYMLNVLFRCYQYKSSLKSLVEPVLTLHVENIIEAKKKDGAKTNQLDEELENT